MATLLTLVLEALYAVITLLLLNLFLGQVRLPADGRRIRQGALPWMAANGVAGAAVAAWQGAVAGWAVGALCLAANLYLGWLLWRFGLKKQFPYEKPLG